MFQLVHRKAYRYYNLSNSMQRAVKLYVYWMSINLRL
jgi:hypothetical protein